MTRRSLVHVLLSLLLLFAQQMALAHEMAHWSASREHAARSHAQVDGRLAKAVAQDQSCDQCLAFAQIAGAAGVDKRSFAPPDAASACVADCAAHADLPRTVAVFQPRAPPAFL